MKIRVAVSDLKEALKVANTVKPVGNHKGFLFTVSDGRCYINSSSDEDYVRCELPVISLEGEDSFVYPIDRVEAIQYMVGWVEIESGLDQETHWFDYRTEEGSSAKVQTYDARLYTTLDNWFGEAPTAETHLFPSAVFNEALTLSVKYLNPDKSTPDRPFNTVQIFDAGNPDWEKGDGTMYAADGNSRACYFHSPEFKGKGLAVHKKHIDYLRTFLAKCGKNVKIRRCNTMTFAIDQVVDGDGTVRDGSVFGWLHHAKTYPKYAYIGTSKDQFILRVERDVILRNLKWLRSEMPKSANVVRLVYNEDKLRFHDGASLETANLDAKAQPLEQGGESGPSFESNVALNPFIDLFENVRGHVVDLRFSPVGNSKMFRTIEKFYLDDDGKVSSEGHECHVTCFTFGAHDKNG